MLLKEGPLATTRLHLLLFPMLRKLSRLHSVDFIDLKPPYLDKIDAKQFLWNIRCPNSKSSIFVREILESMWLASLILCASFSNDIELCLRECSNSLADRAYTSYLSLKPVLFRLGPHRSTFPRSFVQRLSKYWPN